MHLRFQTRGTLKRAAVPCQEPTLFANLKTLQLMFEHFHTHYQLQDLNDDRGSQILNASQWALKQRRHTIGGN